MRDIRKYILINYIGFICEDCYNEMVINGWATDDFEVLEITHSFECERCLEIIRK